MIFRRFLLQSIASLSSAFMVPTVSSRCHGCKLFENFIEVGLRWKSHGIWNIKNRHIRACKKLFGVFGADMVNILHNGIICCLLEDSAKISGIHKEFICNIFNRKLLGIFLIQKLYNIFNFFRRGCLKTSQKAKRISERGPFWVLMKKYLFFCTQNKLILKWVKFEIFSFDFMQPAILFVSSNGICRG